MKKNNLNDNMLDKEFRNKLRDNPVTAINNLVDVENKDVEFKVITNTKDTIYVVFPNKSLKAEDIKNLVAAGELPVSTAGSAGSISTVGTASTGGSACTCFSTISSAGSVGTVGTAGSVDVIAMNK